MDVCIAEQGRRSKRSIEKKTEKVEDGGLGGRELGAVCWKDK
jgi:hypothetical protein